MAELSIGQIGKATETKVETIRYYERIGLLPKPHRTSGNYRSYASEHVHRLAFIRRARELGFSIEDVRELLDLARHRENSVRWNRPNRYTPLGVDRSKDHDAQTTSPRTPRHACGLRGRAHSRVPRGPGAVTGPTGGTETGSKAPSSGLAAGNYRNDRNNAC